MNLITIIGFSGSILALIAFLLNEMNIWKSDDVSYDFLNFLGSFLLFFYALSINSIPFLIINVIWGLFSLKDVILYLIKRKNKK